MNVLVLSQYFWPESFRINEVVSSLRGQGCHVTVLTGQPNYPEGRVFDSYHACGCGVKRHDLGYSIYRVPIVPRGRGGAIGLVANYLSFVLSACVLSPWLLRKQHFDVVFVYAPSPIIQAVPAVWIAFIKRAKLITWVQDLWPESLEVTGFVRNQCVLGIVEVLVRWIYRRCDLLLVSSKAFLTTVTAMAGKAPVEYHPNPGELAFDQTALQSPPALLLASGFNVVFAGNLGTVQSLDTVLDAAELLQPHADVRIVLVGSGSRSDWLQQEVLRRQLRNVQLAGRFAPEAMPGILAQASILLVSLLRSSIMSQTVPSKIQAYLAAGKPVIASLDGEGARVIEASGAGIACPAEDAAGLAEGVLRLKALTDSDLQRMGRAGRTYYKQHFDPAVLAEKLVQHFTMVMDRPKSKEKESQTEI